MNLRILRLPVLLAALVLAGTPPAASGQSPRTLSDQAQVSVLTILPGDAVYSAFGHTAIRVHDLATGVNRIYNYGTFDFRDPMFIPKFTYGQLDYFLSVVGYPRAMQHYHKLQRPVIEQKLNLTPAQRRALFRFLETNRQPENRVYRYDFLFDNCSTRVRDALEDALAGTLRFPAAHMPPTGSFRHMLDPYVANRPLLDFGFDLALGTPTDRKATPYEAMFLPRYLMRAFDGAVLRTGKPLVAERDTVFWVEGRTFTPPAAFPWVRAVGWLLLAIGLVDAGWRLRAGSAFPARTDAALFGVVSLLSLVILFLWLISEHYVTNRNWNLLWAWPTHLWAAWRIARRPDRSLLPGSLLHRYLAVTALAMIGVAALWPLWPQDLHAAALPLVLLLAARSGSWWLRPRTASHRPGGAAKSHLTGI